MSILKSVAVLLGCLIVNALNAAEINVVTDRTDFHLKPLFKQFEAQTGIKVNSAFVEEGALYARVKSRPAEADLVITTDSSVLAFLKNDGLTQALNTEKYDIAPVFKNSDYVILSYRVRSFIIRDDMDQSKLAGYADLASGKYKVCIRPLTHTYNIGLVSQMLADRGETYTRNWVAGVVKNLGVQPQGNDRKQAELVANKQCDIGIMNSYYYGLMLDNKSQRQYAAKTTLFFPDQNGKGSYVLMSGAAILKQASHIKEAQQLVDFMMSPIAQHFISFVNYEYPVLENTDLPSMVKGFAEGQERVKAGRGKFNFVAPEAAAKYRELAVKIITEAIQ